MVHPTVKLFSRYYGSKEGGGATRIDRAYHYGEMAILRADYLPLAFSDHHSLIVVVDVPNTFTRLKCPSFRPSFRIKAEVVKDSTFQKRLSVAMESWQQFKAFGLDILPWWEHLVKPGIKRLAQNRSKEISKERKEQSNLLRLRQVYLNRKIGLGELWRIVDLKAVHNSIQNWYQQECA